jgi:hypothetical protein
VTHIFPLVRRREFAILENNPQNQFALEKYYTGVILYKKALDNPELIVLILVVSLLFLPLFVLFLEVVRV